jgi:hypothetical protein
MTTKTTTPGTEEGIDLDKLEALLDATTPGEWLLVDRTVYSLEHDGWCKGVEQFRNRFSCSISRDGSGALEEELLANAEFIVAAKRTMPALIALARRAAPDTTLASALRDLLQDCRAGVFDGDAARDAQTLLDKIEDEADTTASAPGPFTQMAAAIDAAEHAHFKRRLDRMMSTGKMEGWGTAAYATTASTFRKFGFTDYSKPIIYSNSADRAAQPVQAGEAVDEHEQAIDLMRKLERDGLEFVCMDDSANVVGIIKAAWKYRASLAPVSAQPATREAAYAKVLAMPDGPDVVGPVSAQQGAADEKIACPGCNGIGTWIGQHDGYDDADCHMCDGAGKIAAPSDLAAKAPAAQAVDARPSLSDHAEFQRLLASYAVGEAGQWELIACINEWAASPASTPEAVPEQRADLSDFHAYMRRVHPVTNPHPLDTWLAAQRAAGSDDLSLAVRHGLAVSICKGMPDGDFTAILGTDIKEMHGQDPCAATRRAIRKAIAAMRATQQEGGKNG